MRLFIGVDISKEADEELSSLQKYLNFDFHEKTHFHVTLKFLGEVEEDKLDEIKDKLNKIDFSRFKISK